MCTPEYSTRSRRMGRKEEAVETGGGKNKEEMKEEDNKGDTGRGRGRKIILKKEEKEVQYSKSHRPRAG